jgi:hypothetical protein
VRINTSALVFCSTLPRVCRRRCRNDCTQLLVRSTFFGTIRLKPGSMSALPCYRQLTPRDNTTSKRKPTNGSRLGLG